MLADQFFFQIEIGNTISVQKNPKSVKMARNGYKSMKYNWTFFVRGVDEHS